MQHLFGVDFVARLFDYFSLNTGPKNDWTHSTEDIVKDFREQSRETITTAIDTLLEHDIIVKDGNGFKINLESDLTCAMRRVADDIVMNKALKISGEQDERR